MRTTKLITKWRTPFEIFILFHLRFIVILFVTLATADNFNQQFKL